MRMRTTFVVVAAIMMLPSCAPQVDLEAEEAAFRAITPSWLEMGNSGDAAGVSALFAEDGTLYRRFRTPFVGPEAIGAYLDWEYSTDPGSTGVARTDRIRMAASGDLAVEEGTMGSTSNEDIGRYVSVYEKIDGAWKVAADIGVSTLANGGAPDWAVEYLARWYELYNAGDARGLAGLYAADAEVGAARARGRTAIARYWESLMGPECAGEFRGFRSIGTVAAGWGIEGCRVPGEDGAEPTEEYWSWLTLFERQADGSWLVTRDIGERLGG